MKWIKKKFMLNVRITEEEKLKLNYKSKELKISKTQLIKSFINTIDDELILKEIKLKEELIKVISEYIEQYKRIGNVLNQINKNFYKNQSTKINEIDSILEELWQYINQLRE